jgi:hypothetical protein
MNTAGQIAVTLAALIGFGRLFLADEGDSHRLSGVLILAGLVGKIALSDLTRCFRIEGGSRSG